jgi:hypothetical protein
VSAAHGAKLDAVLAVCERLEREAVAHGAAKAYINCAELARELRGIVNFRVSIVTPMDRALAELAQWSTRHQGLVASDSLIGALLSDVTLQHLEAGLDRAAHLKRCAEVWDAVSLAHSAVERAEREATGVACAEPDCGACVPTSGAGDQG